MWRTQPEEEGSQIDGPSERLQRIELDKELYDVPGEKIRFRGG